MSNINIQRAIENIRSTTTVFTPIVEIVVNAIQAIESAGTSEGLVRIRVKRSSQGEIDASESRIQDVQVTDNGIGFTQENRDSFDTLYSALKLKQGGKGFGRFTCLKYFDDLHIDSVFLDEVLQRRTFSMGKAQEIIVNEQVSKTDLLTVGTTITLAGERSGQLPRKLSTLSRGLVELLLPYFTTDGYVCPRIELSELDGSNSIVLNDYLDSSEAVIHEIPLTESTFILESKTRPEEFRVRVFKMLYPKNKVSKISLVAHKREVTESSLASFIPEFADEFVEDPGGDESRRRNYILKAYVFGEYLDGNVLLERGAFAFSRESDLLLGISQSQIEERAALLAKDAVAAQVVNRQERKRERIQTYVEERAPWHKALLRTVNITAFPSASTDAEIEALLHREKFKLEVRVREDVEALLASDDPGELTAKAAELVSRVSESSKNELVHYVALRKQVLELFKRSLELDSGGNYQSEGAVHNVIFPTRTDDQAVEYEDHNLWILDERLTFTRYLASDLPIEGGTTQRPDIIAFDRRVAFRSENETSNPVTIFEFKRPRRDDFVNPSSKEDPIQQIIRYVNGIRSGKFLTPKGRDILISPTTPFYGYVVCDLTPKVKQWLHDEKNFTPMPDNLGWFYWYANINLYVEVLSWDKMLKDADMRNRVFFHKLGI
ncbi:MAG: ATP-binding protein [Hydrogenophaga sp.]|jgi:hypothetical protein|nr:ATP-binding protein [Hydrogenophaga sp.]